MKKVIVPLLICMLTLAVLLTSSVLLVSSAMVKDTEKYINTEEEADGLYNIDCIIVLGAFVRADGNPSDMLRDRLDVAIALYKMGISDRILMSGDHGSVGYNEVMRLSRAFRRSIFLWITQAFQPMKQWCAQRRSSSPNPIISGLSW